MVLVMTILVALLAGGAVALYIQFTDTKSTALVKTSRASLYCAEAGLSYATELVLDNYGTWGDALNGTPFPAWYDVPAGGAPGIEADIDDPPDGANDFRVTILDDIDEFAVADPFRDNNLKILVKSKCIKYPESASQVVQVIEVTPARQQYEQEGRGQDKVGFAGAQ